MEILFSDNDIVICVKPVGLDSEQAVPQALAQQLGGEIFPLHRLDKNVGGVMIYSRTKASAATARLRKMAIGPTFCGRIAAKTRFL